MNNCSGSNHCRDSRGACAPPFKWAPRSKRSGPTQGIGLQKAEVLKAHGHGFEARNDQKLHFSANCEAGCLQETVAGERRARRAAPLREAAGGEGRPIKNIGSDTGHRTPKAEVLKAHGPSRLGMTKHRTLRKPCKPAPYSGTVAGERRAPR